MDRLDKLRELEAMLRSNLDTADVRSLAGIAKQYRETIREIEEIEGAEVTNDGIAEILSARKADGESAADNAGRS